MAGKALLDYQGSMQGDDTGVSMSEKNAFFSELTGIYWVWKNTRQDITGSCHYRRYFTGQSEPFDLKLKRILYFLAGLNKKRCGLIYTANVSRFQKRILTAREIVELFHTYDAILPQRRKFRYSVKRHYERYHHSGDLKRIRKILEVKYPDYLDSFDKIMNGRRLYANNMFILPDVHFQKFMKWWFSVLFDFEKSLQTEDYQGYQQRIFGFIGERLLNVWFLHEQLKVKELPVIYFKKLKKSEGKKGRGARISEKRKRETRIRKNYETKHLFCPHSKKCRKQHAGNL